MRGVYNVVLAVNAKFLSIVDTATINKSVHILYYWLGIGKASIGELQRYHFSSSNAHY